MNLALQKKKYLSTIVFIYLDAFYDVLQHCPARIETNVYSVWSHLQGTYSSLLTLTSTPIIQTALSSIGVTDMLELPSLVSFPSAVWCTFKRRAWKLWKALQLARITQQALTKAEQIRTCVQHHCDLMRSNQGQMIRNLLGHQHSAVKLDKVSRVLPGGSVQILDEPATIMQEVHNHFQQWTSKQNVQPLSGLWCEVYQPMPSIDPSWYSGLMNAPTLQEVLQAITNGPTGKAGGPSHLTNEMLKHLGVKGQELFAVLCSKVFTESRCPAAWKCGLIYPIPKAATWSGDLDAVRPITLLEHARKVCLAILTGRLSGICSQHKVLHPNNFSVLKGSSIHEPLHALNSMMEDAQERKKELWIVLQDI